MKLLSAATFASALLLTGFCAFSSPVMAQSETPEPQDSAASTAAPVPDSPAENAPPASASVNALSGVEILDKYSHLPRVEMEDGVYYQVLAEGTGKTPQEDAAIFIMIKTYSASGGEITMGIPKLDDQENASAEVPLASLEGGARWTFFGSGGGNISFGDSKLQKLFFDTIRDMKEMEARLIFIPSEQAYGAKGYQGQGFSISPDTDLVIKVSLLRVRTIDPPQNRGFINPLPDSREAE